MAVDKSKYSEEDKRWGVECALKLEDTMNALFNNGKKYSEKARFLMFNLSDPKNQELMENILSQELTAQ